MYVAIEKLQHMYQHCLYFPPQNKTERKRVKKQLIMYINTEKRLFYYYISLNLELYL